MDFGEGEGWMSRIAWGNSREIQDLHSLHLLRERSLGK
jgi:hypothetical protein